jgi:exonuclease SbcC
MQILSVSLYNFKTHHDKYVEFQPGINAICGENGAGKTSVLEAIAWVLFNYQGDYAKEDLIRNGSGNAQVTVSFTSNYDGRTYEVQRCTQRGYTLFDPQLNQRLPYSRIKDEVLPWLKQHLGVPSTTNLQQLFARTVGVPQGTFTADFLQSAEQRKAVFDAILKVEDYKLAYKQMNALRRYAEDKVDALKQEIGLYEESLLQWDELHQRQQTLQQDIHTHEQQLQQLQKKLAELADQRQVYSQQQQRIQAVKEQVQRASHQLHRKQDELKRLEQAVEQAQSAITVCETHRPAYEGYQATEAELQVLNQQQQQRQRLQEQYQTLQNSRSQQQVKLAQLRAQLDGMVKTEQDLAALTPQIEQQVQLETQLATLQGQLTQLQQTELERQGLQQQQQQLEQQAATLASACQRLLDLIPAVEGMGSLEERRDRIQQQLSRLEAARQFEAELRQIVTQGRAQHEQDTAQLQNLLAKVERLATTLADQEADAIVQIQVAVAARESHTTQLLSQLETILQDLATQTNETELRQTLGELQKEIAQRYRWRGELAQLESLQQQQQVNQQQQSQVQTQRQALAAATQRRGPVETSIESLQGQIKQLGYPREKSEILQRTLAGKANLESNYNTLLESQTEQDEAIVHLTTELDQFRALDQTLVELQQRRGDCQAGYTLYLQHQNLAARHPQLQQEWEAVRTEVQSLTAQLQQLEQDFRQAEAAFDQEVAAALEQNYQALRSEADQLSGRLPEMQRRQQDIAEQIKALEAVAEKRNLAQQDLKQKEKAKRFINFARKVYRDAGPRITEQYARAISYQADKLFRDLIGRQNVALEWTRDYEIMVQEGANRRRFINLSGGEQMCAALAVRLALLKVLADIDIAFFDEPTTNMDRPRRASLAEAIGRIKAFQQLFVISHDDTFEQVTENIIFLERDQAK